jgi:hypothetical protein
MKVSKVGRLRWMGHVAGVRERNPSRKLTLYVPDGTRRVGKPAARWLDSAEEEFKTSALEIGGENHRIGTNGEQSYF